MILKPGDTAILQDDSKSHLYIIICEPKGDKDEIIFVRLNTWREKCDETTILNVGDHPFVKRKSFINYGRAEKLEYKNAEAAFRFSSIQEPLSEQILQRVQEGLVKSPKTPNNIVALFNGG